MALERSINSESTGGISKTYEKKFGSPKIVAAKVGAQKRNQAGQSTMPNFVWAIGNQRIRLSNFDLVQNMF